MNIILMLLLISILVLVHEAGHFSVARLFGIKVDRFGFGLPFGPTLYEKKWGDTIVCVHAFLLGGYVSFPDDNPESDLPKDDIGRIANRPVWQRFWVISAGVIANAILAVVLVLLVGVFSGGLPSGNYDVMVKGLPEGDYSSHNIGIQSDDTIKKVNGVDITSSMKFIYIAQKSKQFDGVVDKKNIEQQTDNILGANPTLIMTKEDVFEVGQTINLPAVAYEDAVIFPEDKLAQFNKEKNENEVELSTNQIKLRDNLENKIKYIADGQTSLYELAVATSDTVHPVNIEVEREGEMVSLKPAYPNKKGLVGINLLSKEILEKINGPVSAIAKTYDYISVNTYYMVYGLSQLFTGKVPLGELHGIVAITKMGGDIIEHNGFADGVLLAALISINLAIVNLLPIPALDGGHLVFLVIEKLRGKPLDEEAQENIVKFGFLFLIGLMVLIVFNDIWALVTNKI